MTTTTVKDAIKLKSNAEYLREFRDMTRCPECDKVQSRIRKKGEDCDNPDPCDCYVVEYRGKLTWTNPNWG